MSFLVQFYDGVVSPATGMSFTVTPKSYFSGVAAGSSCNKKSHFFLFFFLHHYFGSIKLSQLSHTVCVTKKLKLYCNFLPEAKSNFCMLLNDFSSASCETEIFVVVNNYFSV